MAKFKIGDRIRIVSAPGARGRAHIGKNGSILAKYHSGPVSWIISADNGDNWWNENDLEFDILIEGQVCSFCKMSCPHKNPNQKNGTFICSACSFVKELEETK
jgi:hypothetical protein